VEAGLSEFIARELEKTAEVIDRIRSSNESMATIETIAARCIEAYRAQNKVLLAGNGGSAADAQHIAGELVGKLAFDRPALAAVALTVDSSVLTATGNDYGYEKIFERQIAGLGRPGDVLIALSTSGCSPNILAALAEARRSQLRLHRLYGAGGRGDARTMRCLPAGPVQRDPENSGRAYRLRTHHLRSCGLIERALFDPPQPHGTD
jgi:D-sedoheptulose 7-phosphate isomerase